MIYMDHAATTPLKPQVLEAMLPYFCQHFANASGSYGPARQAHKAMDRARGQVAQAIGAKPSEVYFTSGGSESDNWALFGVAAASGKKRIIASKIEHHAVLHACQALKRKGFDVVYLDVDSLGRISPEVLRSAITKDTALVSVMLANNEVGTIEPIAELASIAHEYGALMHTDAVQAVGHIPVSIQNLNVDLLSISAHKFYGPKGVGALYVRGGVRLENLIYGGAQEKGLRAGTENLPGIVGMGEAIALAVQSLDENARKIADMRDALEKMVLERLPGIRVNGAHADRLPGHLHLTIKNMDANLLLMRLDIDGICASSASACAAGAMERSHVLKAMGQAEENEADLRLTLGEATTYEEIEKTVLALERILLK